MTDAQKTKSVATQAIEKIETGKNKNLLELVPKGQSPKVYIELIKEQVLGVDRQGKPRPDEDLLYFLYVCKKVGLDPLAKQIYAVYRWDSKLGKEKMSIQTGIDGFRAVAQATGNYAGQDDVKYLPEDETAPAPIKASVTVYKMIKGTRVGFTGSARWEEYKQQTGSGQLMGMWRKMPYLMLGKCAEALALRKAFPEKLSGVYTSDEMAQTTNILDDLEPPKKQKTSEPIVGSAEAATQPKTPAKSQVKKPEVKEVTPDIGAMRDSLKKGGEK